MSKGLGLQVNLNNGVAVFNLAAQKLDAVVIEKLVTKLQPLKNHSLDDIHDKLGSDNKLAGLLGNKGERPQHLCTEDFICPCSLDIYKTHLPSEQSILLGGVYHSHFVASSAT